MILGNLNSWQDLRFGMYRRIYRAVYWPSGRLLKRVRRPHMVSLELTNSCNMRCPHCPRSYMQRSEGFMDAGVFCKLVDELQAYRYSYIKIVGLGEPGMHPEVERFLDYLSGKGIKVNFVTNGTLLERFPPERICAWPIDILGISIDGTDAESYNRLRPGGDYAKLRQRVTALHAHKKANRLSRPVVQIRHVLMPSEKPEEIESYRRDWLTLSNQVNFNTYSPRQLKTHIPDRNLTRCNDQLFFEANVRWDGRVPLCAYQFGSGVQEFLGDLHKNSLEEIWASDRLEEVRTAHQQRQFDKASFCRSCFVTQCKDRLVGNKKRFNLAHSMLTNLINRVVNIS
jgi:pyruvate-formate lyase-activating enzyme